ncbi:MAG: hypothetical protein NT175_11905 [Bacteroidetes bacterium]|nr:hypothetical protein [Bacteroidota bacterium]
MLIIVDKKIPGLAKDKLSHYGEVLEFATTGITYEAISGHPDIFFFIAASRLIFALNTPGDFLEKLKMYGVTLISGTAPVGNDYPQTSCYNAVASDRYFIHNLNLSDASILDLCTDLTKINVNQGYCRCNLLALKNDHFITSDMGIYHVLEKYRLKSHHVSPESILLPGFKHGFFGGTCGVYQDKIFLIGSLRYYRQGSRIEKFLNEWDYDIIELYEGPLFDGGSILFI